MRTVLIAAAASLLAGCATSTTISGGMNPHATFNAWEAAGATKMSCSATPALCSKVSDASQRFTRSGPFMPY